MFEGRGYIYHPSSDRHTLKRIPDAEGLIQYSTNKDARIDTSNTQVESSGVQYFLLPRTEIFDFPLKLQMNISYSIVKKY